MGNPGKMEIEESTSHTLEDNNKFISQSDDETTKLLDVDDFIEEVGEFGLYQILMTFIYCVILFPTAYQTLVMAFVGFNPTWTCSGHGLASGACNLTGEISEDNDFYDTRCSMNRYDWEFTKDRKFSIVTEFDLVCSMTPVYLICNAAVYLGWAIGAGLLGWISDLTGRKTVLFPSYTGCIILGFLSAFSPNVWIFLVARLFIGFFLAGIMLNLFVMAVELVGCNYRALAGTTIWFSFTASLVVCGLQAYFIRDWRYEYHLYFNSMVN